MFIKTFEKLREYIIENKDIESLIQLEYNSFEGACVPVATFVLKNDKNYNIGIYIELSDFPGVEIQSTKVLDAINKKDESYTYRVNSNNFKQIPGIPIAYWASNKIIECFSNKKIGELFEVKQGMATTDNKKFMRNWFEVDYNNIKFLSKNSDEAKKSGKKWFPYNKGGKYRKWYGNNDFVVNYYNDVEELIELVKEKYPKISDPEFVIKNRKAYFGESVPKN